MTNDNLKTMLFVPASRPERIPKALASGAGAVIVDLEDAVPSGAKATARQALEDFLKQHDGPGIYVRINARDTEFFDEDLALCKQQDKVIAIMLPRAESSEDIREVASAGKTVLPLIETARGLFAIHDIAASPAVRRMSYGGLDLSADLGIEANTAGAETIMDQCRYQLLVSSRVAGLLPPIETVFPIFDDDQAVLMRARRARNMGFSGMLCIHPNQVSPVQSGFSPSAEQVQWAQKVMVAAEYGEGAFKVDGQMVDAPVIAMAKTILDRAQHCSRGTA
ncbi:HpcH/HpaI aldolase/citrate lyase family protein [Vreelandella arctica]|uniref:HpcH/HpaI aldolase/citrate lyase family protein n=1 Tax=Vreelandella arctica TaxID=3126499 RepID=UPI00300E535C|tara:strand:- start:344 stop:1180 length:837 start_codon:yes stop_codon:yes gene_type:complete